ncbi:hypothetical protein BACCAP_01083 [Pseudoflavonifractor capillosus ATCC 29799]|uniref:Uncharacterized protein n=1 Tax=Pseudoflavonifractor capillosus ATCC 29799 TaxID=411467 RepID=A6NSA4_9FIRM|nr:hypothetical protein BACCAP_01083 [Pseudoflavonifractor capillosus ATCC 29799]
MHSYQPSFQNNSKFYKKLRKIKCYSCITVAKNYLTFDGKSGIDRY